MNTDLKVEDLQLSEDLKKLPMIAMYDESIKKLLSQVFAGSVILAPVERAFELFIKQEKDNIKFPFISLFPYGGYEEINQNYHQSNIGIPAMRQAKIYNDDTLEYQGTSKTMQNFYQALYFNIPYTISCWSKNRIQALQLVQELMFWLKAQREVKVQYNEHIYLCNLSIDSNIVDSSNYQAYTEQGSLYRFDINISIQAPVYRTQNYLNIKETDLVIELKEGES